MAGAGSGALTWIPIQPKLPSLSSPSSPPLPPPPPSHPPPPRSSSSSSSSSSSITHRKLAFSTPSVIKVQFKPCCSHWSTLTYPAPSSSSSSSFILSHHHYHHHLHYHHHHHYYRHHLIINNIIKCTAKSKTQLRLKAPRECKLEFPPTGYLEYEVQLISRSPLVKANCMCVCVCVCVCVQARV